MDFKKLWDLYETISGITSYVSIEESEGRKESPIMEHGANLMSLKRRYESWVANTQYPRLMAYTVDLKRRGLSDYRDGISDWNNDWANFIEGFKADAEKMIQFVKDNDPDVLKWISQDDR